MSNFGKTLYMCSFCYLVVHIISKRKKSKYLEFILGLVENITFPAIDQIGSKCEVEGHN